MLTPFMQTLDQLYREKPWQLEHDIDFAQRLIHGEIGTGQLREVTEDRKFVVNGDQLKALLRLSKLGAVAAGRPIP